MSKVLYTVHEMSQKVVNSAISISDLPKVFTHESFEERQIQFLGKNYRI